MPNTVKQFEFLQCRGIRQCGKITYKDITGVDNPIDKSPEATPYFKFIIDKYWAGAFSSEYAYVYMYYNGNNNVYLIEIEHPKYQQTIDYYELSLSDKYLLDLAIEEWGEFISI